MPSEIYFFIIHFKRSYKAFYSLTDFFIHYNKSQGTQKV